MMKITLAVKGLFKLKWEYRRTNMDRQSEEQRIGSFSLPENLNGFCIHMVGIKGTGMAALAELLVHGGASVTGSDVPDHFYTDSILSALGICPAEGFSAENIPSGTQLVIYSSAYSRTENPELLEADRRKIPVLLYNEALGMFSARPYSIGIAGVHGKTTVSGMTGTVFRALDLDASVLAGSAISSFGGKCTMIHGSKYFAAETCEYREHFLSFHPSKIVLTGIESDHQDYYPTYDAILAAFIRYIDRLPQFGELIYCADDPGAKEAARISFSARPDLVFTEYGENASGAFRVSFLGVRNGRQYFSLKGVPGEFSLQIPGRHNVRNAAAVCALAASLVTREKGSFSFSDAGKVREALASYTGSKRRSEIVGTADGVLVLDDYAHHPTAVDSTLAGFREFYPGRRLIVDFMSHTYSRTAALLPDFARAFRSADTVILHKIYPSAREQPGGPVDGKTLFDAVRQNHRNVLYFEEPMEARSRISGMLKPGDVFVTMGAGDNWKLGLAVLEDLQAREASGKQGSKK